MRGGGLGGRVTRPPNATDVMSNVWQGASVIKAQQLIGNLLNPDAKAQTALEHINLQFLLE